MASKLYVGNLPYSTNEDTLSQLFSNCGSIDSAKIIMDRDTGRSKGFGFFEMSSDTEALDVISKYDGHEVDGREIKISMAKPQTERRGRY